MFHRLYDMKGSVKGNIAMTISKTFSGLNENALRYLLPIWMSAYSGVVLRLVFGCASFWVTGMFTRRSAVATTVRQKFRMFALGAICVFGYMFFLLEGLTYTTPISSSIFISMQPIWVFTICVIFLHERITGRKIAGILLGLSGALVIILTQKSSDVASDPFRGNMFCLFSSVLYSLYLVFEKQMLARTDMVTVTKWTFFGGMCSSLVMICFTGWDAPVLNQHLFSTPMLVLLFVLIFPTTVSYFLIAIGLRNLSATVVALYGYLILVVAALVSYVLGQDHFDWWQMLAVVFIVFSVYFVEISESRENAKPLTGK